MVITHSEFDYMMSTEEMNLVYLILHELKEIQQ